MPEEFENPEGPDLELPPSFLWGDSSIDRPLPETSVLVEVSIQELSREVTQYGDAFRVILTDGIRQMSILVGPFESQAILHVLKQAIPDRPMTHDLLKSVIQRFGGSVKRVVIDDLHNSTYYAKIYLDTLEGEVEIDSRPSDAIAIAVRFDAPIMVSEDILEIADE
ncbi:MAG TPA: bifunctional nuclease family protein [Fimbriimonadaceae bacterium]|nr:bifunctional nuclease family protein [Fimbriimonadaceae bacterium]